MLIGVDIGTSGTKAALLRPDGGIVATHHEEYGISTPKPGWAEQSPEMWMEKALLCIGKVADGYAGDVKGVSFSGQMHGIVLVDTAMRPVRDAIIWADCRSGDAIREIYRVIGEERFRAITLNRVAAGYGLASLMWLKMHEPETLAKANRLLCIKDYVRSRLVGAVGQEASDASSTCLLDIKKVDWAWDIIDNIGFDRELFVPLAQSLQLAGELQPDMAKRCGLRPGTPLFYGGADTCMAGIGSGVVADGMVSINIGTGGQVGTTATAPFFDKEFRTSTFCHPIPDRWTIYGACLAAGLALKWFRDTFHPGRPFAELSTLAAQAEPGSGGVLFLPYLAGERTPWLNPNARGVFYGMSLKSGAAEMCRSVMEGVTLALDQCFTLLKKAGVQAESLLSMGGGAKSPVWLQIQADVFGQPVRAAAGGDATAGAAILAGVGAGLYRDVFEGVRIAVPHNGTVYEPNHDNQQIYEEARQKYRQLYLNNEDLFNGEYQHNPGW
ncbi:MAG: xylulokinase [Planctomycetes bacterium]|nr:xylulokinase [Planctomycetota bacterium]